MARFLKISKQIHLVGERFIWKPWGNITYMLHWDHGKLKGTLVHPRDKPDKEDITECVYKVPCANCDKTYVGETGRKLLVLDFKNTGQNVNQIPYGLSQEVGGLPA